MSEFKKRITELKGSMSLNAFATKCNIPYSTMRGYLEDDAEPKLDNLIKIANACQTSVAWLAGEASDDTGKKYRGLDYSRHIENGEELKYLSNRINSLWVEFGHAYPESGELSRATRALGIAYQNVTKARHYAEENLFMEYKEIATFDIYYGLPIAERTEKKEKVEDIKTGTADD